MATSDGKEVKSEILIEEFHKEIDLIQDCIKRMANNSFLVKGWAITLVVASIALLADKVNICVIAFLSVNILVCFWYLDAFFLKMERLYRKKYEWVIVRRPQGIKKFLYDLNPNNKNMWLNDNKKTTIFRIMFSKTLIPFYGLPLLVAIGAIAVKVLVN